MSMMPETMPWTAAPPPEAETGGDSGDEPYCFRCLVGVCECGKPARGHYVSAVTALGGTTLCEPCARIAPGKIVGM